MKKINCSNCGHRYPRKEILCTKCKVNKYDFFDATVDESALLSVVDFVILGVDFLSDILIDNDWRWL